MTAEKKQRGGKRPNAGRKPRNGVLMQQKTIRLPEAWANQLIAEYGTLQNAIETLVKSHLQA
jgi:hypothetical protein